MKKIYRTMQGREIDMDQLIQKNETMPAIGNVRMNARGDLLGARGEVIKTRDDRLQEYYDVEEHGGPVDMVKIESRRTSFTGEEQNQPAKTAPAIPTKKDTTYETKRKDLPTEGQSSSL